MLSGETKHSPVKSVQCHRYRLKRYHGMKSTLLEKQLENHCKMTKPRALNEAGRNNPISIAVRHKAPECYKCSNQEKLPGRGDWGHGSSGCLLRGDWEKGLCAIISLALAVQEMKATICLEVSNVFTTYCGSLYYFGSCGHWVLRNCFNESNVSVTCDPDLLICSLLDLFIQQIFPGD